MPAFNESTVENPATSLFGELGYVHHHGPDMALGDPVAGLIHVSVPNVSMRNQNVFAAAELQADSVVKEFLNTAADDMICATQRLTFVALEACA